MNTVQYHKKITKSGITLLLLLGLSLGQISTAKAIAVGFHVSGGNLLDANGNNFIMRGINVPYNWYPEQTSSFANIKAKGANTARVVLSSGKLWAKNTASDVANVIDLCKASKLVCVLEVHDTTGYRDGAGAVSLASAVAYWKEMKSALDGQEAYVIINIGNEPYGNKHTADWVTDTENAIVEMRTAGFQHMLMIDAPNWGQDWENIMRNNAADILASDPNGNTVFSIHMYGVFDTENKVKSYVSAFVDAGLPLVIGEFGHQHSDGNPDEDAIMSVAETNGIGYMGWVWSNTTGNEGYLDMVTNFNPNRLTSWGNRIINGANGICSTSYEASVYGGGLNPACPIVLTANGMQDGWILEASETSGAGGTLNRGATVLKVGDDAANKQYRSILSFDTSALPNEAVITSVTLMLKHAGVSGTNPFQTHGKLLADICQGPFNNDSTLQLADFKVTCSKNKALLYTNTKVNKWYSQSLSADDFQYINLEGVTQFRLRFNKDDNHDFGADFLKIYSGNAGAAKRPQLIIEYHVP